MSSISLMANSSRNGYPTSGFTLIEVLVTLAIIAIGLLGLGAFQARVQQAELESYNRAQALVILNAMVDRINANRQTAPCYAITTGFGTGAPFLGTAGIGYAGPITSCTGFGDVNTQLTAVNDLNAWDAMLQGATEAVAGTSTGGALGARGCITFVPNFQYYVLAVAWQGMTDTVVPTINCGNNLYGRETLRRVVWTTFKPARLL